MNKIDVTKHTKYSLELIFSEADKMASQILHSISENRNKSFVLFALITSLFSYAFVKVTENHFEYTVIIVGSMVALFLLHKNLFPTSITFNGALPENMIHSYFDSFKENELEKEYLATQIENYNIAMKDNGIIMTNMSKRFKRSVFGMLISLLLFGLVYLFRFIECIPS